MAREVSGQYIGRTIRDKKEKIDYVITEQHSFYIRGREIKINQVTEYENYKCFSIGDLVTMGYESSGEGLSLAERMGRIYI